MKGGGRSWLWLQGAIAGAVAAMAPGTALVTVILLCPAMTFYTLEKTAGRPVGRTMLLCGSTATFMPLRLLWSGGNGANGALDLLADPGRPLLAWLACGTGWLLCETIQITARFALAAKTRRHLEGLKRKQTDLMEEWSLPAESVD